MNDTGRRRSSAPTSATSRCTTSTDSNNEGSYSQNVHEVGRWIDPEGSNFWGIHIDTADVDGDGEEEQVIVASDRNLGLYVFTFSCANEVEDPDGGTTTVFYCQRDSSNPEG